MPKRIFSTSITLACLVWISVFMVRNQRGLREGLRYLYDMWRWQPQARQPVRLDGRFASCYTLVGLNNRERYQYLCTQLAAFGLMYVELPVPGDELPNVFVPPSVAGPFTLLVAHYDKSRETAEYQGACDNTAAVAVLLAALREMAANPSHAAVGVLFSSGEERGLLGAKAFLQYSQTHNLSIAAVLNFDMLGRDRLAIRPSALPGIYIDLPLFGFVAYDGRHFRCAQHYQQPDPRLLQHLRSVAGNRLRIYRRFTARSDSNVFQEAGIPSVALSSSNMYYLDLVWERDTDRVELLDEHNLEYARQLILVIASGTP